MAPGLVSVIVPTYDRAHLLPAAVKSVLAQTHRPLELIIIDDGSADDTMMLVSALRPHVEAAGVPLTYRWQENAGAAAARNKGLRYASGEFVCFLDSDDAWKPAFVATLFGLFGHYPSAGLAFSNCATTDGTGGDPRVRHSGLPADEPEGLITDAFPRIVRHMPVTTPSVMVRRAVLEELGDFDTQLRLGEDWDLWYRIARRHDLAYSQAVNTVCTEHGGNTPKSNAAALADKVRLNLKHLAAAGVDEPTRQVLADRARDNAVLLLEQCLREGVPADAYAWLLRDVRLPRTWRYQVGSVMRRQPRWVGRGYAGLVRAMGSVLRSGWRSKSPSPNRTCAAAGLPARGLSAGTTPSRLAASGTNAASEAMSQLAGPLNPATAIG